jgi:glucosamine 6-phosphate synthetase-like amidotransferase/phosphosugar isomerase protein
VNNGTYWNVLQWEVVTWLDVCAWTLLDTVALLELVRSNDVTLLAICVVQKSDASGTVWVVLDVSYGRWNAVLVVTTEVDQTVLTLVATTNVTGGDAT